MRHLRVRAAEHFPPDPAVSPFPEMLRRYRDPVGCSPSMTDVQRGSDRKIYNTWTAKRPVLVDRPFAVG